MGRRSALVACRSLSLLCLLRRLLPHTLPALSGERRQRLLVAGHIFHNRKIRRAPPTTEAVVRSLLAPSREARIWKTVPGVRPIRQRKRMKRGDVARARTFSRRRSC